MTSRTTAPTAALIGRTVRTSLAVIALGCVTTTSVYAQTVPAPAAPAGATTTASSSTTPVAASKPSAQDQFILDNSFTNSLDPVTVSQGSPSGPPVGQGPAGKTAPSFSHFPLIDVVTDFTQPGVPFSSTGCSTEVHNTKPSTCQYHAFDPVDVGGTVRIPITRNVYAAFDRLVGGTLNQAVERVLTNPANISYGLVKTGPGVTYPGYTRDVVLQYRLDELLGKSVVVEEGLAFRHRLYANDGSGVSSVPFDCVGGLHTSACSTNSTEAHYAYLSLTYSTPRIKELLRSTFAFNITGEAQNVDHHVGIVCSAAQVTDGYFGCTHAEQIGYVDENPSQNRVYETTQGVTWTIPLDKGTALSARERWGALNWYENQPFPFRWSTALDLAVNKNMGRLFSLTLRHSDYHSVEFGTTGVNGLAPLSTYISPNVIHVASFQVIGTFHIDSGSLFK
jgi:hypothetical protein